MSVDGTLGQDVSAIRRRGRHIRGQRVGETTRINRRLLRSCHNRQVRWFGFGAQLLASGAFVREPKGELGRESRLEPAHLLLTLGSTFLDSAKRH